MEKALGMKCDTEALKKAIQIAGGANALSSKVGVSYQTVLNWKNGRNSMNPFNCIKIEEAVNGEVTRKEILPNYPWGEA